MITLLGRKKGHIDKEKNVNNKVKNWKDRVEKFENNIIRRTKCKSLYTGNAFTIIQRPQANTTVIYKWKQKK
ncbi:hypothetical protein SUGI_1177980 [Cryptomeria japonica]|nr:hypothetical protein SUGI_1177980 [Cryptomeria japonica]